MKRALRTFLKKGWHVWQALFELLAIIRDLLIYKRKKGTVQIFFWLANPGSVGGTELQLQIIAEQIPNCLILTHGIIEEGKKNRFLQTLKEKNISHLYLGNRPFATKIGAKCLHWIAPQRTICHFFNPAATKYAHQMKKNGFRVYYMETGTPERSGWWAILEQTARYFDHVTSVSQAGLMSFIELFKYQGPSSIIPSMIYPLPYCGRKSFSLLYCGRLTPIKGVDRLIRAFRPLVQKWPDARLTLVGMGESMDELKLLVQELGLQNQIRFTGWLQKKELYSHFYQADLLCLPSETEGLPSVILEAMSIGLPVVATRVGGVAEIVDDQATGILVAPHDEAALSEALLMLAADPAFREKLGQQALAKWKKRKNPMISLFNAYQN